jgi:hypothetical protein
VQAFPSLQAFVLFVNAQPVAGLHVSVVQTLLSLQISAVPPWHVPLEHLSFVVHAFPSLHDAALLACTHPVAGLHESSVHGLKSLQLRGGPPTQTPVALHVSFVVQAFPSLHAMLDIG